MPRPRRSKTLLALRILLPLVLGSWLLYYCLPASAQDTLTYVAEEIENHFDVRQFFDAGMAASDYTSPNAESATQFPFVSDYASTTSVGPTLPAVTFTTTGAIADPTVAPILSVSTGGSLVTDTYHIKYLWIGRFGDASNGTTSGTTSGLATTLLSPETVVAVGPGTSLITMTLPVDYPAGAVGFAAYCDRNGDAIGAFRLCSTVTLAPNTTKTIGVSTFVANTLPTVNNTTDQVNFGAFGQGWLRFGMPAGVVAPFMMRMSRAVAPTGLLELGPAFQYSYDNGSSAYVLRDPSFDIPVCGAGGRTVFGTLAALDGSTLPLPSSSNPVTLVQVGPCTTESVTWKSFVNFVGRGYKGESGGGETMTISLSTVTDATFSGLGGSFSISGTGAKRVRFHDMQIGGTLQSSENIAFDGVRTSISMSTGYRCASIGMIGGTYSVTNSDFTCLGDSGTSLLETPGFVIVIGDGSGAGVATPRTDVVIAGNHMSHGPRTDTNYNGFIAGFYDATATASKLLITANDIHLDNGDATDCLESAPAIDGMINLSSGLVSSPGSVHVRSVGNNWWYRGCQKTHAYKTSDLSETASSFIAIGDSSYIESTEHGTTPGGSFQPEAQCGEFAIGTPQPLIISGGSCIALDNVQATASGIAMHPGCCTGGTKPKVYIDNYYIEMRSSGASNFAGVSNECDAGSGCDVFVSNATVRKSLASSGTDFFVSSGATSVGSTLVLRDVDYTSADIVGTVRTWRGLTPIATAPTTCSIGDTYTDTSGGYCVCTSSNTWSNISGVGNCT